jgi:hypothetical protein
MTVGPTPEPDLRNVVTPLTGDESAPDRATLAAAVWLVRRYSSYAYIRRTTDLFRGVVAVFSQWAGGSGLPNASLRFTGGRLHGAIAALERGLTDLGRGYKTPAYDSVLDAVSVRETLTDARSVRGVSLDDMQERLPAPAALAATRACAMCLRIQHTLAATWSLELLLGDGPRSLRPRRLPDPIPPLPATVAAAADLKTGDEVQQTGVWIPITIRNGCPNLLLAGHTTPPLTRAGKRILHVARPAFENLPAEPAWIDHAYVEEPTTWRLLWPDERYRDGLVVPEPEFLDDDDAIPEGLP